MTTLMKERGPLRDTGAIYDKYYSKPPGEKITIKKGAKLTDTLDTLPSYVKKYAFQAEMIAPALRDIDGDIFKTCYNIWSHFHNDYGYRPDPDGIETIQSLWHLWWSTGRKGDCDCLSFGIACVLHTLKNISYSFRVTQYPEDEGFSHIYIVVHHKGKEIIIDACMDRFNAEAKYINKIEVPMDLQFLNGLDPNYFARSGGSTIDADDLLSCQLPQADDDEIGKLNLFNKVKEKIQNTAQNIKTGIHNTGQHVKEGVKKVGAGVKKGVHVINRINPLAATLRLGLLAGMKLNLFGVAGQLRYAYLSEAQLQSRGVLNGPQRSVNMKRFARFKKVREKLEKIFFNAGGKPENLKEAILTGKGNQDKDVALAGYALSGHGLSGDNSVREIIGDNLYYDEIPPAQPELKGLGVVGTAAVVTAASGILATIAGILKNIGPLFQKGEPGPDAGFDKLDEQAGESAPGEEVPGEEDYSSERESPTTPPSDDSTSNGEQSGEGTPPPSDPPPNDPPPTEESWADKAKAWAIKNKTPLIVAGIAATTIAGVLVYRKFFNKKKGGHRAETVGAIPRGAKGGKTLAEKRKENRHEKIMNELRLSRMK